MGDNLKTGFVILNYNDYKTTIKLVEDIKNYKSIDLIVIVDNCSTDDSYEKLHEYVNNKVILTKSDKNGGYAYGNNFGIRYLIENYSCDIVFISNPDVEFEEALVIEIKKQFKNNSKYSVLSGVMLDINGNVVKNPYWDIPSYKYDLLDYFFIGRRINKKEFIVDYTQEIMDVEVVPGSFLAIKSDVMQDIGYYDENTFLYCEERILAKRLRNKGYKSGLITGISYKHMHSVSIKKTFKKVDTIKIFYDSKLYYNKEYNKVGKFRENILKIAAKISLLEYKILERICK
ncbi:MAG: glycosyltransferase family 2 protein [Intestinibacter sp.]